MILPVEFSQLGFCFLKDCSLLELLLFFLSQTHCLYLLRGPGHHSLPNICHILWALLLQGFLGEGICLLCKSLSTFWECDHNRAYCTTHGSLERTDLFWNLFHVRSLVGVRWGQEVWFKPLGQQLGAGCLAWEIRGIRIFLGCLDEAENSILHG